MKRIISLILSCCMIFSLIPLTVNVVSAKSYLGSCGENLEWEFNTDTATLTITGSGDMTDFTVRYSVNGNTSNNPWWGLRSSIKTVIFQGDVTSIGNYAFYESAVSEVIFSDSITHVGNYAFFYCNNLKKVELGRDTSSIAERSFGSCSGLSQITIYPSLQNIDEYAFSNSENISNVYFKGTTDEWNNYYAIHSNKELMVADLYVGEELCNDSENDFLFKDGIITKYIGADPDVIIPSKIKNIEITEIGSQSFAYNSTITSAEISDGIKIINQGAFENCSALKKVIIGNDVTIIGNGAFQYCDIESLTLGNNVSEISSQAFFFNRKLKSIKLTDNVTIIGKRAFGGTSVSEIVIPKSVKTIEDMVFTACESLKSIIVDEGNSNYCSIDGNLYNKDKTTLITYAYGKTDDSLLIPEGVESIYEYAMYYADNIVNVTIPNSVIAIGNGALPNSENFLNVYYMGTSEQWNAISGWNEELNVNIYINNVLTYPKSEFIVENGVITRYLSNDLSVTIPETIDGVSITGIGSYAFSRKKMQSIDIPNTVTNIGDSAFNGCSNLKSIILPSTLNSIEAFTFAGSGLENINIPDTVETIGYSAFQGCQKLKTIILPSEIKCIEDCAFEGSGLESISIPASVNNIGTNAFNTATLLNMSIDENNETYATDGCALFNKDMSILIKFIINKTERYEIPNSVKTISGQSFSNSSISEIVFNDSLEIIGIGAFENCSNLTEIDIPNSVASISDFSFDNCSNLTKIQMSDNVTMVGNYAFRNCSNLTDVYFSNNLTYIGEYAFAGCSALRNMDIPNNVKTIDVYAFRDCVGLESVSFPETLTKINYGLFYGCTKLNDITFTTSVTEVDRFAFYNCCNLKTVYYNGTIVEWDKMSVKENNSCLLSADKIFGELISEGACGDNITWNVDLNTGTLTLNGFGEMPDFESGTAPWYNMRERILYLEIDDEITHIGNYSFQGMNRLSSVVFPIMIESIGNCAFEDCASLIGIGFPEGIEFKNEEWCGIEVGNGNNSLLSATISNTTPLGEGLQYLIVRTAYNTFDLIISGDGEMPDTYFPWNDPIFSSDGNEGGGVNVEIGAGVTHISTKMWSLQYDYHGQNRNFIQIYNISVDKNNKYYFDDDGVVYSKDNTKLIVYPNCRIRDAYHVLEGTQVICDYAFQYARIKDYVVLPEGIEQIGNNAFYYSDIKDINFPSGLNSIGDYAFYRTNLENISFPDGLTYIGDMAFVASFKSENIVFPNGLTYIGYGAFQNCEIAKVQIPSTVTIIGYDAFFCAGLQEIDVHKNNENYMSENGVLFDAAQTILIKYPTKKENISYTVPETVETISNNAFYWARYLKELVINENIKTIESGAMSNSNIETVTIEGACSIGHDAFRGCESLKKIHMPKVVSIEYGAFAKTAIEELNLPNSVQFISGSAFEDCSKLKKVYIPYSVERLSGSPFWGCTILSEIVVSSSNLNYKSIDGNLYDKKNNALMQYALGKNDTIFKIPENIYEIKSGAFKNCILQCVTIPKSVKVISFSAFAECNNLREVIYEGTRDEWEQIQILSGNESLLNANITYAYDLIRFKVEGYDFTRFGGVWNVPNATVTCNGVSKTTDANGEVTFSCEEVGYVDNGDYSYVSYEVECEGYFSKSNSHCGRPNQYLHTVALLARDPARIYPQNIVLHGTIPEKFGKSRTVYTQDVSYHRSNEIRIDKQLNRSYRMDLDIDWNGYEPGNVYLQNNETGKQLAFINNSLTFNPKFDLDAGSDYAIVAYNSDGSVSAATKIYFSVYGTPSKLTDVDYTINHKGKAFVRINLKNAQGGVPSNKKIQYSFEGYDGVYEGTTDTSGTIIVETPVLSGKNETKQLTVIFNDNTLENSTYSFDVFISDLSYSQSWKGKVGAGVEAELSFGAGGSVGVAEGEAKLASIGVEGKAAKTLCIETEYNNGKQRIKLSTSADGSIAEKLSVGILAKGKTPTESAKISVAEAYGTVEAGTGKEISLVIDDFNPNNSEHLKQIAMFLLDCSLTIDKNTTNVMLQKLLKHLLNDGNDVYNEQYTNKSAKLGVGAKAGFFEAGDFKATLIGASGETFYQHKSGTDANDNTVYSTELTADVGVDIGEVKMIESNIGSENLLSFDWLNNSVELKATIDSSDIVNYGVKDISIKSLIDSDKHSILWGTQKNSTYSTLTFDEDEAKGLTMKVNNLDRFLNNKRWLFNTDEFCQLVNDAVNSGNSADYTKSKAKENGFNASFDFGLTALAGAEVGFTISAIDSTEYVTQNGIMENGVFYKTSESYISDSEAKSGIDTIISLAIDYLSEIAKSYFVDKTGELSEGVDLDKAKVEEVTSSLIDVGVDIIKIKVDEISPFSLMSIEEEQDSVDSSYRTKTIGESYVVNFKDGNGNYVDELDGAAKLTLSYDLSDLENSGISSEQTGLNSMSIYKWNESKNVYTRVGSTVDIENCSVSAEISGSGEYVLAIDDEAPTVTDITILNNSQNPIISAIISDASGLNEFTLQLDDKLVLDENSFYDYYDSKTSLFRYTCSTTLTDGTHVAIFNIVDGTGNKMEPIYYTFTVDTSSPIINSVTIPETSENTTIAFEANVSDENVSRVLAVMEYNDTTYTYELVNKGGIWTVNVENLPEFAILKTYIVAYDSFGNESKSDIYETIIAKNSGDEISIGIISIDSKDIVVGINNKLEDTNSCIYVAGYSSQGELEEIKTIDVSETGVMLKPAQMYELHDTYKVFCWESLNTLKPLNDYSEYFKFYN